MAIGNRGTYINVNPIGNPIGEAVNVVEQNAFKYREEEASKQAKEAKAIADAIAKGEKLDAVSNSIFSGINKQNYRLGENARNKYLENLKKASTTGDRSYIDENNNLVKDIKSINDATALVNEQFKSFNAKKTDYNPIAYENTINKLNSMFNDSDVERKDGQWIYTVYKKDKDGNKTDEIEMQGNPVELFQKLTSSVPTKSSYLDDVKDVQSTIKAKEEKLPQGNFTNRVTKLLSKDNLETAMENAKVIAMKNNNLVDEYSNKNNGEYKSYDWIVSNKPDFVKDYIKKTYDNIIGGIEQKDITEQNYAAMNAAESLALRKQLASDKETSNISKTNLDITSPSIVTKNSKSVVFGNEENEDKKIDIPQGLILFNISDTDKEGNVKSAVVKIGGIQTNAAIGYQPSNKKGGGKIYVKFGGGQSVEGADGKMKVLKPSYTHDGINSTVVKDVMQQMVGTKMIRFKNGRKEEFVAKNLNDVREAIKSNSIAVSRANPSRQKQTANKKTTTISDKSKTTKKTIKGF